MGMKILTVNFDNNSANKFNINVDVYSWHQYCVATQSLRRLAHLGRLAMELASKRIIVTSAAQDMGDGASRATVDTAAAAGAFDTLRDLGSEATRTLIPLGGRFGDVNRTGGSSLPSWRAAPRTTSLGRWFLSTAAS